MKNVKSTDPRKAAIVATLIKVSGCTKITNVKELIVDGQPTVFTGDCLKYAGGNWDNHGTFTVSLEQVEQLNGRPL